MSTIQKTWYGYNHNGTLLGEYDSEVAAKQDVKFYISQTGNAAYYTDEKEH